MLQEILTTLGGSAIVVMAVAWFTRSIVLHFLNKDIVLSVLFNLGAERMLIAN